MDQLNSKLRELLGSHIDRAVERASVEGAKRAAAEATRALEDRVSDGAFLAHLVQRLVDQALAQVLGSLDKKLARKLDGLSADLGNQVARDAMALVKANAPSLGKSALPHVIEEVKAWIQDGELDLGGGGDNSELLVEFERRLRAVEAHQAPPGVVEGDLEDALSALAESDSGTNFAEITQRLAALEDGGATAVGAPSEELIARLADLESSRTEFAEQVAEQVGATGDTVHEVASELRAAREELAKLSERVLSLGEKLSVLERREPVAAVAPAAKLTTADVDLDLTELAERVAVLAVGPLMQAIDGRLGEANLEDFEGIADRLARLEEQEPNLVPASNDAPDPTALAERVAMQAVVKAMEALDSRVQELGLDTLPDRLAAEILPKATTRVLKAIGQADRVRTVAEESDSGYLDEEFANFRRDRLREQGKIEAPTDAEAGSVDRAAETDVDLTSSSEDSTGEVERLPEAADDHGALWTRDDEPEPEDEKEQGLDEAFPTLPGREDS
jgi:hypothetical protein